jgi:DNA-binding PadR family transcriptional regulator
LQTFNNKEENEILSKYGRIITGLKNIDRLKIALILLREGELSFAEIKQRLGEDYNTGLLYHNLEEMMKNGIINNIKKLDLSSNRVRTSFYKLTEEAEDFLRKLRELMKSKK